MIPDFRTYLKESVWGDLRKKSLGQETRIEDDIDYMNRDEFYEYLKATYISRRPNIDIIQIPAGENVITIPFAGGHTYYMMEICYYEGKEKIECVTLQDGLLMYIDEDIYKAFRVTGHINSEIEVEVYPIDSYEVTNSFIVKLIDWLLEHSDNKERNLFDKKKNIRESVWGDLRKKSLGQEERIENDVNHMSFDDFTAFITDTYSKKGNWFSISDSVSGKDLHIDLDIIDGITLKYNVSEGKLYNILIDVHDKNLKPLNISKLENDFQIEQLHQSPIYEVRNLDGTISNNTYVKLIEFFMANKDTLLMESVWGDIRKKSLGKEDRIQDDVNNLDINGLCEYIKDKYKFVTNANDGKPIYVFQEWCSDRRLLHVSVYYDSDRKYPNIPINISFDPIDIKFMPANMPGEDVIKYLRDEKLVNALKSSFDLVEDDKDRRYYHINPLNGEEANNKFILRVLDTFAENARRPIIKKKR